MPPAALRLKRRAEFLRVAAEGRRVPLEEFVLQVRRREDGAPARIGFTMTKRLGGAVVRNRARRRLREAARAVLGERPLFGCDLVLIGRIGAVSAPFPLLLAALRGALARAGLR